MSCINKKNKEFSAGINDLYFELSKSDGFLSSEQFVALEQLRLFVEINQHKLIASLSKRSGGANTLNLAIKIFICLVTGSLRSNNRLDFAMLNAALHMNDLNLFKQLVANDVLPPELVNKLRVAETKLIAFVETASLFRPWVKTGGDKRPKSEIIYTPLEEKKLLICATARNSVASLYVIDSLMRLGVEISCVVSQRKFSKGAMGNEFRFGFNHSLRRKLRLGLRKLKRKLIKQEGIIEVSQLAREQGLGDKNLLSYCNDKGLAYTEVDSFNGQEFENFTEENDFYRCVYMGKEIVRQSFVESFRGGAFHSHPGYIPQYRGMECIEWGVLQLDIENLGVSVQSLNTKLDGGGVVAKTPLELDKFKSIDVIRSVALYLKLKAIIESVSFICMNGGTAVEYDLDIGRQYFIMHDKLRKIVEEQLRLDKR